MMRLRASSGSLRTTSRPLIPPTSLPVLTLSEPQRMLSSHTYARRVLERIVEYLIDAENLHGTGRLYLS
jgi:hypothetical protein